MFTHRRQMLQLASGNVPTVVHILELDSLDLLVDVVSRHPESVLAAHYRHHPASICDEMLAVAAGAGVENERFWLQLLQAIDWVPCFIRLGVPAGCQHDANCVATLAQRAGVLRPIPPLAAATNSSYRSTEAIGSTTWDSGSPKRQLNSITMGPVSVIMRPA